MMTKEQFEIKAARDKKAAFDRWMKEPMTRMVISQLPPNEQLEVILKAAFESGFNAGSGSTAGSFIESLLPMPGRRP